MDALNLFPYFQLWRIGREPYHSSKCSTILSIAIILIIAFALIERIVAVIRMQTLIATEHINIQAIPRKTVVSTFQNGNDFKPFMVAFDIYGNSQGGNGSAGFLNIMAYSNVVQGTFGQIRNETRTNIQLQTCTIDHFSHFPAVKDNFNYLNSHKLQCLPLNNQFIIQGLYLANENYSSLNFEFNCSGSCINTSQSLNIMMYTLSSSISPTNNTDPQQYFLSEETIPITPNTYQKYHYNIAENILHSDKSLFPWTQIKTTHNLMTERFHLFTTQHNIGNQSTAVVSIQRSPKTFIYHNQHLKFLAAFSYVGGIFQALIGIFFFMGVFGRIFFQFKFAKLYLKSGLARHFGLGGYLKQIIFQVLRQLGCQPDWQQAKKRDHIRNTVNSMLEVVYLNKRIDFLERAMTSLFKEHQLKGLYLIYGKTGQDVDLHLHHHSLRDHLVYFLAKRKNLLSQQSDEEKKQMRREKKNNKKIKKSESPTKMQREEVQSATHIRKLPEDVMYESEPEKIPKNSRVTDRSKQIHPKQSQVKVYRCQLQKKDDEMLMEAGKNLSSDIKNEVNEQQLKQWLVNDFSTLLDDSQRDQRSKNIVDSIQSWLINIMKQTAKELKLKSMSTIHEILLEPMQA